MHFVTQRKSKFFQYPDLHWHLLWSVNFLAKWVQIPFTWIIKSCMWKSIQIGTVMAYATIRLTNIPNERTNSFSWRCPSPLTFMKEVCCSNPKGVRRVGVKTYKMYMYNYIWWYPWWQIFLLYLIFGQERQVAVLIEFL